MSRRLVFMGIGVAAFLAADTREAIAGPNRADVRPKAAGSVATHDDACQKQRDGILAAPAGSTRRVTCDLSFGPNDVVRTKLQFVGAESSGVHIRCNGAQLRGGVSDSRNGAIEIYSVRTGNSWSRARDIQIEGCRITGTIRVWGMDNGGTDYGSKAASAKSDFIRQARRAAPTNIVLRDLTITGLEWIPLYVATGVTRLQLIDSEIKGASASVGIYLDHESGFNTFRGNTIHPKTTKRELVAIDGSSDNLFVNNRFSSLNHGGLYFYRNCGERAVARHNEPQRNQLINNVFYYNKYRGPKPAVYFGARDGSPPGFHLFGNGYCELDDHLRFGSGVSDQDHARNNAVMQNQIYKFKFADRVKTKSSEFNSPNWVARNQTVTARKQRKAGCYLPNSFKNDFLSHGRSTHVVAMRAGRRTCEVQRCDDGALVTAGTCRMVSQPFGCHRTANDSGCSVVATCPDGTKEIIAATAACDLEKVQVSNELLGSVRLGWTKVVRASDNVSDGMCKVGATTLSNWDQPTRGSPGKRSLTASCKEHDRNGGDCQVRGTIYCLRSGDGRQPRHKGGVEPTPAGKRRPRAKKRLFR